MRMMILRRIHNNIKNHNFKKNKEKDKNLTVDEVEGNDFAKYRIKVSNIKDNDLNGHEDDDSEIIMLT